MLIWILCRLRQLILFVYEIQKKGICAVIQTILCIPIIAFKSAYACHSIPWSNCVAFVTCSPKKKNHQLETQCCVIQLLIDILSRRKFSQIVKTALQTRSERWRNSLDIIAVNISVFISLLLFLCLYQSICCWAHITVLELSVL